MAGRRKTGEQSGAPTPKKKRRQKAIHRITDAAPAVAANGVADGHYEPIMSYADMPADAPRWLWYHRLRFGATALLAGDQSSGKSTLAALIAAAVSKGQALPGGPDLLPRGVLWLGAEELAKQDIRPRLRLAGADTRRLHNPEELKNGKYRRISLPTHLRELTRIVQGLDVGLLIFDPITSHIDDTLLADSGGTARRVLESLTELGRETGACSLCIKHPRKGAYGSLIERVSGSREWIQVPRTVLFMVSPVEHSARRVLVTKKPGPPSQPPALGCHIEVIEGVARLVWEQEVAFDEKTLGQTEDAPGEKDATADARDLLRIALEEGQQRVTDLEKWAKDAGLSLPQLRRARVALGVTTHHEGGNGDRAWYWSKPGGGWPQ